MDGTTFKVALVSEVFHGADAATRLAKLLAEARDGGALLAVLPELPLDPWYPATRQSREQHAEPPGGPRHTQLARAAAAAGIAVIGGAIVRDAATGVRHNTALVFDREGVLRDSYRKLHLPEEPGYWETSHYAPGSELPRVIDGFGLPFGIQLCSDANRPELSHALGALGAEAVFVPRATPRETYERWKLVLRANAVTSGLYVISTNRPRPESGVDIGGPSIAVAPDGELLVESERAVAIVTLARDAVRNARNEYPGYLATRADLYARAWNEMIEREDQNE